MESPSAYRRLFLFLLGSRLTSPAPGCAPPGRADSDGDFAMYRTITFSSARFPVSARLPLMIACAYWSVVYSVRTLLFFQLYLVQQIFWMCGYRSMGPRARAKLGAPQSKLRTDDARSDKVCIGGDLKNKMWSCFHTSRIGLLPCNFAKFGV